MWLRVLSGPDAGKTVEVAGDTFVVGRRRGCDLVLRDPQVAPRHAALRAAGERGYAVEDLGSASGTFVAGRRIRGPVPLRGDEQLCFGDTFVQLAARGPRRRRSRALAVAGAAAAVVAAAGVTAGVLAPRTGGGPADAVHHAAAPAAAPAGAEPVEPAAQTVVREPGAEGPSEAAPGGEPAAGRSVRAVLLREDFADPKSGWEVFQVPTVTAGYDEGAYVIRITESRWYATVDSGRAFRRPVVAATVWNPGRSANAGFGILCHYRGEASFDVLAVGTDGTYAVLRQHGETLTVLSNGGRWAPSPHVPVAAERYRLRADCRGKTLRLWVNGRQVGAARAPAPEGRIGLFAAGLGEFRFDDVVVEAAAPA